jgi:hypothetical protein
MSTSQPDAASVALGFFGIKTGLSLVETRNLLLLKKNEFELQAEKVETELSVLHQKLRALYPLYPTDDKKADTADTEGKMATKKSELKILTGKIQTAEQLYEQYEQALTPKRSSSWCTIS